MSKFSWEEDYNFPFAQANHGDRCRSGEIKIGQKVFAWHEFSGPFHRRHEMTVDGTVVKVDVGDEVMLNLNTKRSKARRRDCLKGS